MDLAKGFQNHFAGAHNILILQEIPEETSSGFSAVIFEINNLMHSQTSLV